MKRCPQCEFIYEDEQNLCDMDGSKLAFDSRPLPNLQALASPAGLSIRTINLRGRVVPAVASLVLATVLLQVYNVSTHRQLPSPNYTSAGAQPTNAVATPTELTIVEPVAANNSTATPPTDAPDKSLSKTSNEKKQTSRPVERDVNAPKHAKDSRIATAPNRTSQTNQKSSSTEEDKKDSKVGSLLKKTGRLLKKPFKL